MTDSKHLSPPIAKAIPKITKLHNADYQDDYEYMNDKNNPIVQNHIAAENQYTDATLADTIPLQQKLREEFKTRVKSAQNMASLIPTSRCAYEYIQCFPPGHGYPRICRKVAGSSEEFKTILDLNDPKFHRGEHESYLAVGSIDVSPDATLLAFSLDHTGEERFTIHILDLHTGQLLQDSIPDTIELVWLNDSKHILYCTMDEATRPYKVFKHKIGTPNSADEQLYHETGDEFHLTLRHSTSRHYIILDATSYCTTEVHIADATNFQGFKKLISRKNNVEYTVDHDLITGDFIVRTNEDALNFKVVRIPQATSEDKETWTEILPNRFDVLTESIVAYENHLVVFELYNGLRQIRILEWDPINKGEILHQNLLTFSEPTYFVTTAQQSHALWQPDATTQVIYFSFSSFCTPTILFEYNMKTRELHKKWQMEISDYDSSQYQTNRLYATAPDGSRVPISIVHKKGIQLDGSNPLLLRGYGSYGLYDDVSFDPNLISLLNRGLVYGIAHIRGGCYLGKAWRNDGKLLHKMNTFTDFIACGKHLIQEGYTNKDKFAIYGRSAGGMLIGAAVNMAPELYRLAILEVPFLDCYGLFDPNMPLALTDREEWGNPEEREFFDYQTQYSPYQNVKNQNYPNLLFLTGLNDPRVMYYEAVKMVAKLRKMKTDNNTLMLKVLKSGHFGGTGEIKQAETAMKYAAIIKFLNMNE